MQSLQPKNLSEQQTLFSCRSRSWYLDHRIRCLTLSMKSPHLYLLVFTLVFIVSGSSGGKILVFPLDGSHWVNMKVLIEELHARGHQIAVLRPSDSWYVSENSPLYTSIALPCGARFEANIQTFLARQLEIRLQKKSSSFLSDIWTHIQQERGLLDQFSRFHWDQAELITHMFEDESLMRSLHAAKYDLVLTDPATGGGAMLARRLQVPLVYNVRWTIQGEAHFITAPSPLSYVPFTGTELTDKMSFSQRVKNVLSYFFEMDARFTEPAYKPLVRRYFGPDEDYSTFFLDADIWLMRNDFVFEFPRPTMPNIVYMGGFQCKPSNVLPDDLEEFVQSSGDHGVVIMTLGTLVRNLSGEISEEIAAAFAQLPQKVIWKYTGQRPTNLGNNTLLVKWLPQNDLLGHPKTRVFVTHGGTNGVQEAIHHGVPLVGLPLFYDQPDNLSRIRAKGAAVIVDIAELNRRVFKEALVSVLYDPTYRENMQMLSKLHRDQPMKPLDQAVFWIEYVMRHKGARHLQTRANKMSWFVYNSVDVILTLLAAALLVTFIWISVLRLMWRKISTRTNVCSIN